MNKKQEQQPQEPVQMTPITQLFEDMPISISALGKHLKMSEVTLARIRDGKPTRRPTAAKLLWYFSDLYGEKYNLRNVSGITLLNFKKGSNAPAPVAEPMAEDVQKKEKHAA
jgi:hypothetical protein